MCNHFFKASYLIACAAILMSNHAMAQQDVQGAGFGIEMNGVAGKVFKHTKKFRLPIPDHSTALDLNFVWKTHGRKDWQQRINYPTVGFGITYVNYGIDSVYGRTLNLYPNLTIPIIHGNKLEWTIRMGFGVGLISKHYDRYPNWDTLNNALSSQLNNFSIFMTDLRYHINKHWDVQLGANFFHISNATYHVPNLGINMYGAHVGLRYFPVTSEPKKIHHSLTPLKSRWLVEGRFSMALTQSGAYNGPLYHVYLASIYASKRWNSVNKMFGGIDYSYHQDIYAFLRNNEIDVGKERQNSWKSAIFAGNEFGIGHVGIILQVGVYIKQAELKAITPYYEKLGMHYYIIQNEKGPVKELFLSALLKTHLTEAELAEFGVGVGF